MDTSNSIDENYLEDNPPPGSIFRMQLVLNKCKPFLSLPEDEPILVERLNELGVKCLDDLKLLNFENDFKGLMKIIQCRQLQLELSKAEESIVTSGIHNISSSSVEHERSPTPQSNSLFGFTIPQFRKSIRKALQKGSLRNDERLHVIETVSNYMFDVMSNPGLKECRQVGRMLEGKFPNALKNKEFEDNSEYISKQLLQHIYYVKRKERLELKQSGSLRQNYSSASKNFNEKKYRFGTHPERYAPNATPDGETLSTLDHKKTWLKATYLLVDIDWNRVTSYMKTTYASQRQMILNCDPIDVILLEWPFLGKELYLKNHFYYLTNLEDTVVNSFKTKIPTMLKFVQAEAEKKRKDNNLQTKLIDIIKSNNNNKNNYSGLLTILLCYMNIMKENVEMMFIMFEDSCSLDEVQSNDKIISTPVVACLGDIWSNPKCFVFVDKQCLWRGPVSVEEAIIIMFMSFYVFNIQYPKELAGILQLLQSSMFNINDEGNKVQNKTSAEKFVPKLLKLMKDYDTYVKKWTC